MPDSVAVGWVLVIAGPVLALIAFLVARSLASTRSGLGAAALVGLVWFVLTAEWLPPAWTDFWDSHTILAGTVASVLLVVAGWFFARERLAKERLAALLMTWREWVDYQCGFISELLEEPVSDQVSVTEQRVMAASISSRLVVQQQWIAALFVISTVRSDERNAVLIARLGKVRDAGTFALREFAQLEALLASVDAEYVDSGAIQAVWKRPFGALRRLRDCLESMRSPLGMAHWEAQADSGQELTHPLVVDVNDLRMARARAWSGGPAEGGDE